MKQKKNIFQYTDLLGVEFKKENTQDLAKLYEQSCSELALQQEKRDYILKSYILLISIVVPFILSLSDKITPIQTSAILLSIGLIGYIYSLIIIRYRIYKESYWITCIVLTQLLNLKEDSLTKHNVQALYYLCMKKKWGKYVVESKDGDKHFANWNVFCSNIFSAESLLFMVMAFFASIILGLGLYIFISYYSFCVSISIVVTILLFIHLTWLYFKNLKKVFKVLVDNSEESFNFTFSKAWFLHFYQD